MKVLSNPFLFALFFAGCPQMPGVESPAPDASQIEPQTSSSTGIGSSSAIASSATVTASSSTSSSQAVSAASSASVSSSSVSSTASSTSGGPSDAGMLADAASIPDAAALLDAGPCQGVLYYVRAPSDTESEDGIVIAGATGQVLGKFRVSAACTNMPLPEISAHVAPSAAGSIVSVSLYQGSALLRGPVAPSVGGFVDFGTTDEVVPREESRTYTLKANLNTIAGGAVSGTDVTISLCFNLPGDGGHVGTACVLGFEKRLRKTKPTITLVALPTTTLANGTQTTVRLTISADAAEQVSVKHIAFESALDDRGGSPLVLTTPGPHTGFREVGQASYLPGSALYHPGCDPGGTLCAVDIEFDDEIVIFAGTSKTFDFRPNISGADTNSESVSTQILGDTEQVTGELGNAPRPATWIDDLDGDAASNYHRFVWSDNSAVPHNWTKDTDLNGSDDPNASNDWTNGRFVKLLPSDVTILSR